MRIQRTGLAIGCVISFALVGLGPMLSPGLSGRAVAQAPHAVHPSPWQALAQTVAMHLTRAGMPAPYVPALTREYLGALQRALMLGMPAPQADMIATQHVTAVMQQALAAMGSGGSTSTYGHAGGVGYQIGSDGQGFTGAFFSEGTGVSCGPDGGCVQQIGAVSCEGFHSRSHRADPGPRGADRDKGSCCRSEL